MLEKLPCDSKVWPGSRATELHYSQDVEIKISQKPNKNNSISIGMVLRPQREIPPIDPHLQGMCAQQYPHSR